MMKVVDEALQEFFLCEQAQARRIFHGRGQLYPGLENLVIDWFKPVVLIGAFAEVVDLEQLRQLILDADKLKQVSTIILQRRYERGSPSEVLYGEEVRSVIVEENGLKFDVHPGQQQNAGLFLDMRPLRQWLLDNSRDKNVLNLFAYTCSLSVAALAGDAECVTNVDISKTSIRWGDKNHELNQQGRDRVKSIPHNLFRSWGRIKQFGRYDLVIIDPPTRQRGSFEADKNYGTVLRRLSKLCKPGADVIATVNSPFLNINFLPELFAANAPEATFVEMIPASPEFVDKQPDKALKIYRYRMAAETVETESLEMESLEVESLEVKKVESEASD